MEAKREEGAALWSKIAVGTAICSTISALIAFLSSNLPETDKPFNKGFCVRARVRKCWVNAQENVEK